MAQGRFLHEYQKSAVNGASPLKLVIMLYDGALKFMELGKSHMAKGNIEMQNASLQKAQRIVTELMSCLDMEQGGEIAQNLFGIYSYVLNELISANVSDDPAPIERSIRILSELRESWTELESNLSTPAEVRQSA